MTCCIGDDAVTVLSWPEMPHMVLFHSLFVCLDSFLQLVQTIFLSAWRGRKLFTAARRKPFAKRFAVKTEGG